MRHHDPFEPKALTSVARGAAPALRKALKSDAPPEILSGSLQLQARDLSLARLVQSGYAAAVAGAPDARPRVRAIVRALLAAGFDRDALDAGGQNPVLGDGTSNGCSPWLNTAFMRAGEVVHAQRWSGHDRIRCKAERKRTSGAAKEASDDTPKVRTSKANIIAALTQAENAGLSASLDGSTLRIGDTSVQLTTAQVAAVRPFVGGASVSTPALPAHDLAVGDTVFHTAHGDVEIIEISGATCKVRTESGAAIYVATRHLG